MKSLMRTLLLVGLLLVSMLNFAHAEELEVIELEDPGVQDVLEQPVFVPEHKVEVKAVTIEIDDVVKAPPEEKPIFTLTFLADDGDVLFSEQLKLGEWIVAPFFIPTKDGFVFEFWYDAAVAEETDKIEEYRFGWGIEADTVLKPCYSEIIVKNDVNDDDTTGEEELILPWGDSVKGAKNDGSDGAAAPGADTELDEEDEGLTLIIIDDPDEEEEEQVVVATNLAINIFSTHSACMEDGSTIDLWAELIGFDGIAAALQWQYFDGVWRDVEGATSMTYSFMANKDTVNYGWRLVATVLERDAAEVA